MMQNLTQTSLNKIGSAGVTGINGGGSNNIYGNNQPMPDNFIFEQVDPSVDDEDCDSDTDTAGFGQVNQGHGYQQNSANSGLKPGKKTKGRVKIKMEFIENKLRRYTTFSKRKTGIMKKAYELSTLTGTQVMLLVASETGHVYTFATRKLQPMITSDSGKALIQTCLNSPDPQPGAPSGNNALEQRMNPSGFEETDLSCAVGDDEQPKLVNSNMKTVFPMPTPVSSTPSQEQSAVAPPPRDVTSVPAITQVVSMSNQVPTFSFQTTPAVTVHKDLPTVPASSAAKTVTISASNSTSSTTAGSIQTMQIPLIFQQGTAISMLQPNTQTITGTQSSQAQNVLKPASLSQVVSALNCQTVSSSQNNQTGELNTPLPASTPSAINIMQGMTPGIVMYHTPQGIVYATPTQNLNDQNIFNFQQPATAISMTQADQASGQQIITIPVPVSLSGTPLLQLAPPPNVESSTSETTQVQQPPLKKAKK